MRRLVLAAVLAALLVVPAAQAWTWPVGGAVLEPFLFDPAHPYAAGQHRGIVIGAEPGGPVLAPAPGTVTFAGTVPSSGKSVTITTSDGLAVTLTHLGAVSVAKNATVAEGAVVATAATAGDADFAQPYVHLGVRVAADAQGYLDPLTLLPARVAAPPALVPPAPVEPAPAQAPAAESTPAPAPAAEPVAPAPAQAATSSPPAVVPVPAEPAPSTPAAVPAPAEPVTTAAVDVAAAPAASPVPAPAPAAPEAAEPQASPAPAASDTPAAVDVPAPPAADVAEDAAAHGFTPLPQVPATSPAAAPRAPLDDVAAAATDPAPRRGSWAAPAADLPAGAPLADPRAADARSRPRTARPPRPGRRHATQVRARVGLAQGSPRHGAPRASIAVGALVVLLLGGTAALAAKARRKAVPTMDGHALLRDHPDLLRQRPAAHRSLVHDHRGRHPRAPSPAARRGDVLPDGGRRARDEGLARC